ncbi:hypothetical protein [Streptomyces sp. NPDC088847]
MMSTLEIAEQALNGEWHVEIPETSDEENNYLVTNDGGNGSSGSC